jgi:hypothetical protein
MRPLIAVLGAPVAWLAHLLISYAAVGLACAAGWPRAHGWFVAVTVAALAAALASGLLALRRWQAATHAGWERELGLVGILGAVLFGVAIIMQAVVPAFAPLCPV